MIQAIKGYTIEEEAGKGGFGVVYRARQSSTFDRDVAIKVIKNKFASEPRFIRRFEAEAEVVARLEHPFIVPLYDYWRDPDGAYLVMRWLKGGTIENALQSGPIPLERAAGILNQVALALSAAHQQGVIHRDIKPSNILLDEHGNAYLADFGIAKDLMLGTLNGETAPNEILGSPGYLAPEQARREVLSPRTDVYSLGVTLFEMLAGHHPFGTSNEMDKLFKHLNEPLPLLQDLPTELQDPINEVIQQATQKNPLARYADPLEMSIAFRDTLNIAPPSPGDILSTLTRREQEILALIAEDKTNAEIAGALFVTVGTVRTHLNNAYKKLNVRTRNQAKIKIRELHLVFESNHQADSSSSTAATYLLMEDLPNPYKGLNAFTAADARDFFGRKHLTNLVLKRMQEDHPFRRFMALVGPSGSGKSSLAKAGIIPAIWRGDVPSSQDWYTIDMIPGSHPLDELEVALNRLVTDQQVDINAQLSRDNRGLVRLAQMILPENEGELFIVIDQFEEVFTLVDDEQRRQHFLNLLQTAITDPRSRVRILVTLRADFFDRPLQYPEIGEVLRARLETVLPLSAEELENAITKPAAALGVKFADGLVSAIIADINYQPGALPLLQYALTELFDRREGNIITREVYAEIGGTVGALARRADALFDELDNDGKSLARQLFLRMVTLGEGTEDTRRRVTITELLSIADNPELAQDIIDAYASYRLLALDHDPATRKPTAEVAHEAILREWERLRQWLNESRDDIKMQRELSANAETWQARQRDEAYLIRGSQLNGFKLWSMETSLALRPVELDFLSASMDARRQREANKAAQVEREERLRTQRQRVLQGLVGVFVIATIISVGLAIIAFNALADTEVARDEAEANFRQAEAERLAGDSALISVRGKNPELASLLALQSLDTQYTTRGDLALQAAMMFEFSEQIVTVDTYVNSKLALSPDAKLLAISTRQSANDETTIVLDTETLSEVRTVPGGGSIRFLNNNHLLTATTSNVYIVDASNGNIVQEMATPNNEPVDMHVSPNRTLLATSSGNQVSVWEIERMELLAYFEVDGDVADIGISHDDQLIAISKVGETSVWNIGGSEKVLSLVHPGELISPTRFSPDDQYIATGTGAAVVRLWSVETGEIIQYIDQPAGFPTGLEFSQDGDQLLFGDNNGEVYLWDINEQRAARNLVGHQTRVSDVLFAESINRLFTVSEDNTLRVWSTESEFAFPRFQRAHGGPYDGRDAKMFSPDGSLIYAQDYSVLQVFDVNSGQEVNRITADGTIMPASITTDGSTALLGFANGNVETWSLTQNTVINQFGWPPTSQVLTAKLSPNDQLFAVGSPFAHKVGLWHIDNPEPLFNFDYHQPVRVEFSRDSTMLVVISFSDHLTVYDVDTGIVLYTRTSSIAANGIFGDTDFSRDGHSLVHGQNNGNITILDAHSGKQISSLVGHDGPVLSVEHSYDGNLLLSSGLDGTAKLWDVRSGNLLRQFSNIEGSVVNAVFHPSDDFVLIDIGPSFDLWHVDIRDSIDYLCSQLPRDFTADERERFAIDDRPTCPKFAE